MFHSRCFICSHIYENTKPILLIIKEEGDIQLLCGELHEESALPRVVGIEHLVERDSSIKELADIPNDFEAHRQYAGDQWSVVRIS